MKVIQKYFLALVPPSDIFEQVDQIKLRLRDEFGIKYALKSPPHITLKMPFNYNEAKEEQLIERLGEHLAHRAPFSIKIKGVGNFGNRVIFLSFDRSDELIELQQGLKVFCKQQLHLTDELSDRNFHAHMTVAFKDLKASQFPEVMQRVKENEFIAEYSVANVVLLKRQNGSWMIHRKVPF